MIILSGSIVPFIFSSGYSLFLVVFLVLLIFYCFYSKKLHAVNKSIAYYLAIISLLIILMILRSEQVFAKEYFGVLTRITIAFLFTLILAKNEFKFIYTNIIYSYSILSLMFYFAGIFFFEKIFTLPIMFNDAGTGYRHIYLYFYQGVNFWNFRNTGLFWEGGAFVIFLGFALIFQRFYLQKDLKKEIILIVTCLTTFSTIGYAIILIILLSKLNFKKLYHFIASISIIVCGVLTDYFKVIFLSKFDGKNISGIDRLVGQIVDLKLFSDAPIIGVGYSRYASEFKQMAFALGSIAPTSTNSITGLLALNGLIYSLLLFTPFFLYFFQRQKGLSVIYQFIITLLIVVSQGIFNQLIFLVIIFYSFQNEIKHENNRT